MEKIFFFSILIIALLNTGCRKQNGGRSGETETQIERFLRSTAYNRYAQQFPSHVKDVVPDAAKINKQDGINTTIHLPVIRNNRIYAVIIGIPTGKTGEYDLIYQDNSNALNGNGNIYQFSSSHDKLAVITIGNGKLKDFRIEQPSVSSRIEEDCGFKCRLDRCYTATKAMFPGDAMCSLLDIFLGVCSSATVTTCLIKMAIGQA